MTDTLLLAGCGPTVGASVARRFHDAGWNVALVSRSGGTADEFAATLDRAASFHGDVTDPEDVSRVTVATRERYGPVDCLVCNASAGRGNPVDDADPATFERLWRVSAFGPFLLARACLDDLRDGGTLLLSGTSYDTDPPEEQVEWGSAAAAARGLATALDAAGLRTAYVRIAAPVRPGGGDPPAGVAADAVADRYLDLATAETLPTAPRIDAD